MAYSSLRKIQKSAGGMDFSNAILYNRWVLYFVFIVAFGDLLLLFNQKDITSGVVFIVVGILTSFFSKNMIVILCVSMAVSHIFKLGIQEKLEGLVSSAPSEKPPMKLNMEGLDDKEDSTEEDEEEGEGSSSKEGMDEDEEDTSKSSKKKSISSDEKTFPEDILKAITKKINTPTASIPTPSSN
jgi:hypothetical protein